jgi:predicted RecB family endonuclease
VLDEYGLSRDDLMETMKEMQFLVDNDKVRTSRLHLYPSLLSHPLFLSISVSRSLCLQNLFDRYTTLDTKLKTAFTKKYNSMSHQSQALIEEYQASKRRARGKVGASESLEEGEEFETTEDLEAAREVQEEKDSDDDEDLKEFMKKHSKKSSSSSGRGKASETKTSSSKSRKK